MLRTSTSRHVSHSFRALNGKRHRCEKRLLVEPLECRRLLAGDLAGDADATFGSVHGSKWEDLNGDGLRDTSERGLAGVAIYADLNGNGDLNRGEPVTYTMRDIPETDFDETGMYWLPGLPPGKYFIREIVPKGFSQTFPNASAVPNQDADGDEFSTVRPEFLHLQLAAGDVAEEVVAVTVHPVCVRPFELDVVAISRDLKPLPNVKLENRSGIQLNGCGRDTTEFEIAIIGDGFSHAFDVAFVDVLSREPIATIPATINVPKHGGGHFVTIEPGTALDGLDFGNQPVRAETGSIHGTKWLDRDGDGQRDEDEVGLGGVQIYLDKNRNGRLDRREPRTVTMFDDPATDFDEGGQYWFSSVEPRDYVVREVVTRGFKQTFPGISGAVVSSETGQFAPGIATDMDVTGVDVRQSDDLLLQTAIDVTVEWPDSCGTLLGDQTTHTIIGRHILVDLHGTQVGEGCATVISPQTQSITVEGLELGSYTVVATLHELLPASDPADPPRTATTLGAVAQISLARRNFHVVTVEANQTAEGVDFGNQPLGTGSIHGTKWLDENANGRRDNGEPGLPGVTIYLDTNFNGRFDLEEPHAVTMEENPDTEASEAGMYWLKDVPPGWYRVREVVPDGYTPTYPRRFGSWRFGDFARHPLANLLGQHVVLVRPGQAVDGIDFGNARNPENASVAGVKWLDLNGNSQRDPDEVGVAGVTVFADRNLNGKLDAGEPSTATRGDDPDTEANETGQYVLAVPAGRNLILEVAPEGQEQVHPSPLRRVAFPYNLGHVVSVEPGQKRDGVDFGNRPVDNQGFVSGTKWLDENGNGQRDADEPGVPGVTIFADLNLNGVLDSSEPRTMTRDDNPVTDFDESGQYVLRLPPGSHLILEVLEEGFEQIVPNPAREIVFPFNLGHRVELAPGQSVDGIDFANRRLPDQPGQIPSVAKLPGDADGDGEVGFADFVTLANHFGKASDAVFATGDFDGDGQVGFSDFTILANHFGQKR